MPLCPASVEIGALDGLLYSNTLMLEKCLGWRGLLIEGNPTNAAKLLRAGRLNSVLETKAVCNGAARPRETEWPCRAAPLPEYSRSHLHSRGWVH